jgi:hypothetical protein
VEAATLETGDVVLLTERTRDLLRDSPDLERRGEVALKGRSSPVVVYALGAKERSVGHRAGDELAAKAGSQIGEPDHLVHDQQGQDAREDAERRD